MPSNNAWNGKWSGADKMYVRTRSFSRQSAAKILERLNYSYDFGDGWRASVEVSEVTGDHKRKLDKASAGFCGYEWMIDSIIAHGKITAEERVSA
jgi:hypothetical protein